MSETQAKETDIEIEPVEGEADGETVVAAPEAVEIKIEDGDQPAPKKVSRFETRLRNKNNQISEAQKLADERQQELEATRAELELIKLRDKQKQSKAPDEDDFDDPYEFQRAKNAYEEARIAEIAAKKAEEIVKQSQQQTYQATQSQKVGENIGNHYKRADALPITNYDALEGNTLSILGETFIQTIIETTDNSELLIASLGASPAKAREIAELLESNPAKAFAKAVSFPINPNLSGTSLKTPDPETKIKPGESTQLSGWELKLDKARDKAAETGNFSYITEVKKQARAAGVTL